jgi:starch phosphorylase
MNKNRKIAYFSMEIGLDPKIPTYSGGLGVLAGDTIRSFADLAIPAVAVTLLYRKGYFYQKLDQKGQQQELPDAWEPEQHLKLLPHKVTVAVSGRTVAVRAWQYDVAGIKGYDIPVLFLDTNSPENSEYDRGLSDYLYGGDAEYRLSQEVVLGIGGVRMLRELGFDGIARFHMNEGHAALLVLELHREAYADNGSWDHAPMREKCVFTTHTPVPAGHDKFPYDLVRRVLGDLIPVDVVTEMGGRNELNMTLLALSMSHYINGVAKRHGEISREMFPGYTIDWITNGIHSSTWVGAAFHRLYSKYIPGWRNDPFSLRYALSIPDREIWDAHQESKKRLIDLVNATTGVRMDQDVFTVCFARRSTAYKRTDLVFRDIARLTRIAREAGRFQIVFAGKAHPRDREGKEIIKRVIAIAGSIRGTVPAAYLANYDIGQAKVLTAGADLWLNTPRKPMEASGTSGMKAAVNGVPCLSVLDGWWIEGCMEGLTGWAIGSAEEKVSDDDRDAGSLYDKLEKTIIPLYYGKREQWIGIMRHAIALNGSFFNAHRMVQQYLLNAYY